MNVMYYVYLLQSKKVSDSTSRETRRDKKYYIGHTDNFDKRLEGHNQGLVKSTKHRRPFILVGYEEYDTRDKARWREYKLKKSAWQRKKFIEKFKHRD